jgi:selenocysteine lyase/cysteine desulfurase
VRSAIHDADARYFDCAFIACVARELIERATLEDPRQWSDIVDGARVAIASTLAPGYDIATRADKDSHVSLFANTTSAFTRLLAQIERGYAGSRPTLLSTDLEYPGCIAAVDDSWGAPVVMAQLAAGLTADPTGADAFLHDALVRAFNVVKPRVVLVSHVIRATGQVLSKRTLRYFREANPCVLVIVDGSQAVGNIVVDAELLELCDFYISSGHKWLGGMATSGFVWQRDASGRWQVADPAQSVAFRGQRQPGGSGNAAAWTSLADSVSDMVEGRPLARLSRIAYTNRRLARLFHVRLQALSPKLQFLTPFPRGMPPSGLVSFAAAKPAGDTLGPAVHDAGFRFSVLEREQIRWRGWLEDRYLLDCASTYPSIERASEYTDTWPRRAFRFCFHYWHSEQDVISLADTIAEHLT